MNDLEVKDLDFITNLMLVFFHAGEQCIRLTEDYFKDRYRQSQDYAKLRKKFGKAQADLILGEQVNKILRHNEKYQYGKIIKHAEQLKSMMDEVTAISIGSVESEKELTGEEMFNAYDYLMKDARWLCKIYSMICNCEKESDIVKIESTIKLLAKGDMASEKVISRFE
jgi:hypothetical protein